MCTGVPYVPVLSARNVASGYTRLETRMEPTSIAENPLAARCRTFHQCGTVFRTDDDGCSRGRHGERTRCRETSVCRQDS